PIANSSLSLQQKKRLRHPAASPRRSVSEKDPLQSTEFDNAAIAWSDLLFLAGLGTCLRIHLAGIHPCSRAESLGKSLLTSSISLSGIWLFSTSASAPRRTHSSLRDSPLSCVMTTMRSSGKSLRNSVVASRPLRSGMLKSVSTRSGRRRPAFCTRRRPSEAVPTISNVPSNSRYRQMQASADGESSATRTRMGRSLGFIAYASDTWGANL